MRFRPCIDLHNGRVKQIVGSTLQDNNPETLHTNFVADQPPAYFAKRYCQDGLPGGHIIMLGPNNEEAALQALEAYPGGLQIGGGITAANASTWLNKGAAAVIVTSYVFNDGMVHEYRLEELVSVIGREHLVLDLSCRKRDNEYFVVTDRWQNFTEVSVNEITLEYFSRYCSEFLVHAADVEGKCAGIEEELVSILGQYAPIPTTYAGGVQSMADVLLVKELGQDRLDITVGSCLDLFGGSGIKYEELVVFNRQQSPSQ